MSRNFLTGRYWKELLTFKKLAIGAILSIFLLWLLEPIPWRMGISEGQYVYDAVRGIPVVLNTEDADPEWTRGRIEEGTTKIFLTLEHPYQVYSARKMEKAFLKNVNEYTALGRPCLAGRVGDVAYLIVGQQSGQSERMQQIREILVSNLLQPSSPRKITKKPQILSWMEIGLIDFRAKFKL